MKFNRLLLVSIISTTLLCGCFNKNKKNTSSSEEEEVKDYIDEADYEYENKLPEPSNIVHNMDQLSHLVDYHAFYKDKKSFEVQIADDYVYSTSKKTVDSEINYLYWYGELVNGVMGIKGTAKSETEWTIKFKFYHDAYIDAEPNKVMLKNLAYGEHAQTRADNYDNFTTNANSGRTVIDVATTQQLWYAVEWGYSVNPIVDSPAEKYYNLAKDVLRKNIDDSMDNYQKTMAIYDYIEHNATYCYEALEAPEASDPKNYPDEICARYKAFYLEGFFDNKTVVCDGFSKVYTLLGRMEGLNIYRGSGTSDKSWKSKEVAGHAYCYVEIDDKYYLSCPTWGQSNVNNYASNKQVLNKNYFLSPRDYISPYTGTDWPSLNYATGVNNVRYFQERTFESGGTHSTYITSSLEFNAVTSALTSSSGCFLDLYFSSVSLKDNFISSLGSIKYLTSGYLEVICYKE